jgi:hypothetical protein
MSNLTVIKSGICETERNGSAFNNIRFIRRTLADITERFFHLGFLLHEAYEFKYYTELGYDDLYGYAETEFDLGRTTVKNLLSVYRMTCVVDGGTKMGQIQKRYEGYGFSQLVEMASLQPEFRRVITQDMTVRQIKEYKRERSCRGQMFDRSADPLELSAPQAVPYTVIESGQTSDREPEDGEDGANPLQARVLELIKEIERCRRQSDIHLSALHLAVNHDFQKADKFIQIVEADLRGEVEEDGV